MKTIEAKLFDINHEEEWRAHLDEEGYVVLKDILPYKEKIYGFGLFAEDWKQVTPKFDLHDKTTWRPETCPLMWNKGMVYWNGFGQSNFMWYLRTHPRIRGVYERLFGTNELVVSFDGFSTFISHSQKSPSWLHIDQSPLFDYLSVQGSYNFLPVKEDDAGFCVIPRSHKTYRPEVKDPRNFLPIPLEDEHIERAVKLLMPENCFTLWNSRTGHANAGMTKQKVELNRLTAYITYFPKKDRKEEVLQKRLNGYKEADNCSHWAIYHHKKAHPARSAARYESRGFNWIRPKLTEDGEIPPERLELI